MFLKINKIIFIIVAAFIRVCFSKFIRQNKRDFMGTKFAHR